MKYLFKLITVLALMNSSLFGQLIFEGKKGPGKGKNIVLLLVITSTDQKKLYLRWLAFWPSIMASNVSLFSALMIREKSARETQTYLEWKP